MSGDNLRKAGIIFNRINYCLAGLAGVIIIYLMASVSYEVFMRYFLNRPTIWVVDIAQLTLIYVTLPGAAWLLRHDGHVNMDMVLMRLKPRALSVVNLITNVLSALTCAVLAWFGAKVTWEHLQEGVYTWGHLSIPSAVSLSVIPLGFFLLFIQFVIRARSSQYRRGSEANETSGGRA